MNLIFLDLDEVLTNIIYSQFSYTKRTDFLLEIEKTWEFGDHSKEARSKHIEAQSQMIDPGCMHYLNMLVTTTNSKVVICSSWRNEYPFNTPEDTTGDVVSNFKELFSYLGYPDFPVIGFTEHSRNRGVDVALFMEKNYHLNIERYLIIDDTPEYLTKDLTILTEEELLKEGLLSNNPQNSYFKSVDDLHSKNLFFWSKQPHICTSGIVGFTAKDALDGLAILSSNSEYLQLVKEHEKFKDVKKTYNIDKFSNQNPKTTCRTKP